MARGFGASWTSIWTGQVRCFVPPCESRTSTGRLAGHYRSDHDGGPAGRDLSGWSHAESCSTVCWRGFPADRIRCNSRVVGGGQNTRRGADRVRRRQLAEGDLLIGADGLHSRVEISPVRNPRSRPAGAAGRDWSPSRTSPTRTSHYRSSGTTATWPVAGGRLRSAVVVRLAVVARLRQTGTSDRRDPGPTSQDGPTWSIKYSRR